MPDSPPPRRSSWFSRDAKTSDVIQLATNQNTHRMGNSGRRKSSFKAESTAVLFGDNLSHSTAEYFGKVNEVDNIEKMLDVESFRVERKTEGKEMKQHRANRGSITSLSAMPMGVPLVNGQGLNALQETDDEARAHRGSGSMMQIVGGIPTLTMSPSGARRESLKEQDDRKTGGRIMFLNKSQKAGDGRRPSTFKKMQRTVNTQTGTPRLDTVDGKVDEEKSECNVVERNRASVGKTSIGFSVEGGEDPLAGTANAVISDAGAMRSRALSDETSVASADVSGDDDRLSEMDERAKYLLEQRAQEEEDDEASQPAAGGGMFQGISDAVVASEWNSYWHVGWRIKGRSFLRSKTFNCFVVIGTFYAILGIETTEATNGTSNYLVLHICSFLCFMFFAFEIGLSSATMENYLWSFFWGLDVVGTISLLPDIAFLWPDAWAMDGLALARAGRVARTGTRAVRVVRFFRIVRMLRLFRIVKLLNKDSGEEEVAEEDGENHQDQEMNAYRTKLAKKHAAVVEMRVVTGVIMMLMVMPNLEYANDDNSIFLGLEMLQSLLDVGAQNATVVAASAIYAQSEGTLVYLRAGNFTAFDGMETVLVQDNVISTEFDLKGDGRWDDVEARYELTGEVKERAGLTIMLTVFLSFLFALGSFIFNNDAHELMFQPIARLTNVTSKMSSQLFSINSDSINGSESSYIESVLTKIARFFETDMHKVTTLYTPDNSVWTIDVRKEKEEIARVVGSTHRITSGDLHNMCKGAKKDMVQKFMFQDFLNDPLAVRYFHKFLRVREEEQAAKGLAATAARAAERTLSATAGKLGGDTTDYNENNLLFWEEIRRYKRSMSAASYHARRIFKTYVHPEGEFVVDIRDAIIQSLYDEIILGHPTSSSYDLAEREIIDHMRLEYFPKFLEGDMCNALIIAKKGLPKAIMVENEYGQEELDELDEMTGNAQPIKLNLVSKGAEKTDASAAAIAGVSHLRGDLGGGGEGGGEVAMKTPPTPKKLLKKSATMSQM